MNPRAAMDRSAGANRPTLAIAMVAALGLGACSYRNEVIANGAAFDTPQACGALATAVALPPHTRILAAVFETATPTRPAHCRIDGDIDARVGVDGQPYATRAYYGQPQRYAYFQGRSEGGREALLMSQRYPEHYDGIIAGDPTLHLPLGPLAGIHTTQLFAGLAKRLGKSLPDGQPAIGQSFSDGDLLLVRNAVLKACDALDGLSDGIVDNLPACTAPRVHVQLLTAQCPGAKGDSCLTADQIQTLETEYAGAVDSKGRQLYSDWPWDPGMGGVSATDKSYSQAWRSWWLGSPSATANNAIKLSFVSAISVLYTSAPKVPVADSDALPFSLAYDFDTDPAKIYGTSAPGVTPGYRPSSASMYSTDATDLSPFKRRGGKLMVYHGGADSSVSLNDTLRWYEGVARQMGGSAQDFARMYVVPGMNHCRGGPATDSFDMLPQLVQWVEAGTAPDSVLAKASNPGYFNVGARSRPLCPRTRSGRATRARATSMTRPASAANNRRDRRALCGSRWCWR